MFYYSCATTNGKEKKERYRYRYILLPASPCCLRSLILIFMTSPNNTCHLPSRLRSPDHKIGNHPIALRSWNKQSGLCSCPVLLQPLRHQPTRSRFQSSRKIAQGAYTATRLSVELQPADDGACCASRASGKMSCRTVVWRLESGNSKGQVFLFG